MRNSQITITEIQTLDDVTHYRDATGFVLEVGNFIVQGILNDTPEGIRIFSNKDDALAYIAEKLCDFKPAKPAKKSVKKAAKAVKTKRKYVKKSK